MFRLLRDKESDWPEIAAVLRQLDCAVRDIDKLNFQGAKTALEQALTLIAPLKDAARLRGDEDIANLAFLLKVYVSLLTDFIDYQGLLCVNEFSKSWSKLQDCLDCLYLLRKNFPANKKVLEISEHFLAFEKLYPYRLFVSSEMLSSKQTCSICGRSGIDPLCEHIPGEVYWGELAYVKNHGTLSLRGVAFVENPVDKRCVATIPGETLPFTLLEYYLEKVKDPLIKFVVRSFNVYIQKENKKMGRNEPCHCGSGKKYKKCCGIDRYEKGLHGHIELLGSRLTF